MDTFEGKETTTTLLVNPCTAQFAFILSASVMSYIELTKLILQSLSLKMNYKL